MATRKIGTGGPPTIVARGRPGLVTARGRPAAITPAGDPAKITPAGKAQRWLVGATHVPVLYTATLSAESEIAAALAIARAYAAALASASTIEARLTRSAGLVAALASVSALSGHTIVARALSAEIAALSALSGGLAVTRPLSASIASVSAITATATFLNVHYQAAVVSESTLTATLAAARGLAASLASVSAISGNVAVARALSATMNSVSTLSGTAAVARPLAASMAAVSAIAGDLKVFQIAFTDSDFNNTAATAFTFSGQAIGAAATGRRVLVGVSTVHAPARTISSVTIGGNAATQLGFVTRDNNGGGTFAHSALYILQVDAGTTADIVVTWSASVDRCGITVFAAYGLTSSTAHHALTPTSLTSPVTGNLNIPAAGVVAAHVTNLFGDVDNSFNELTTHVNQAIGGGAFAGGSKAFGSAQTGLAISCSTPSATSGLAMVLASFA